MKEIFNPNNYNSTHVMNCNTKQKAKIFCNFMYNLSKDDAWISFYNAEERFYDENTCYRYWSLMEGKAMGVGSKDFYESNGFIILNFDSFYWGTDYCKFMGK